MPENPEEGIGPAADSLAEFSMKILASLHAAMVNFHLYPPTSDIVEVSVKRAMEDLGAALQRWGSLTFSEVEGRLLINDFCPDERDQKRPNTVSFLKDLALWEVRSITFEAGLREEDLRGFLEVFSRKRADRSLQESLSSLLEEAGVNGVAVDEKIYVSMSKEQEASVPGPEGDAMAMLKEEVFIRYLLGTAPPAEVSSAEVSEMMSDPQRIHQAFQAALAGFESMKGPLLGVDKARAIKETVDRMYSIVMHIGDEKIRETLSEEIVNILAALEPDVLVEVLSEEAPEAVDEEDKRREIIASVEGENIIKLTEQVIEKYKELVAHKEEMDPADYEDIAAVLNEIIADIYLESDPSFHPEINRRIRESGLLAELVHANPRAGEEIKAYSTASEIRASRSLRSLESLTESEVIEVAGKLMELGDREMTTRIIEVVSRNLHSARADFRMQACRFLGRLYQALGEEGFRSVILDHWRDLVQALREEEEYDVKLLLVELLGYQAKELFLEDRLDDFAVVAGVLLQKAEEESGSLQEKAAAALASLGTWEVGKPLSAYLFQEGETGELAARVLAYMDRQPVINAVIERLRGEGEVKITPALGIFAREAEEEVLAALKELLEADVREEVYLRSLRLLEAVGTEAALSLLKEAEGNPIPSVRAQAYRSMARVAPGDPTLLPHYLQALKDEAPEVRREGARGLGTIDDPKAVEALISIVEGKSPRGEEDPKVEEAACLALAKLGPEKAVPVISDILKKKMFSLRRRHVTSRVKAAACYALGCIGGPEAVDLLRGYLDDPDPILRNEARKALAALRQRGYGD
jgi:HEAT repeat protein